MSRLINTIALLAAAITLVMGLWQDWGVWAVSKRMVLSYLGFFFLGSVMALIVRSAALFEAPQDEASETPASQETQETRQGEKTAV